VTVVPDEWLSTTEPGLLPALAFSPFQWGTAPFGVCPLFDIRQEKSNSRRIADPAVRKLRKIPEVSGCGDLYIRIDREIDPKSLIYSSN